MELSEKANKKYKKNIKNFFCLNNYSLYKIILFILLAINFLIFLDSNKPNKNDSNKLIESYIKAQKDFCTNETKYYKQKYENEIISHDVKFNELNYQIYIYKSGNFLLWALQAFKAFEIPISVNMINALQFYKSKNNIVNNKDILILDVGGNVGWYPSLLGRYGYTILSFEAFEKNNYVAMKNYCYLNKNSNVILITKGLGEKDKICTYYVHKDNAGNGMTCCKRKFPIRAVGSTFVKESEVEITTLNSFMPYLLDKNIALMKLDVEGHELQVLKGGKELITKYHVPFIVLEFTPKFLKRVGSDPKELPQFLVDNGYKISIEGFLSKNYISVEQLLLKFSYQITCYFIHNTIIEE